MDIIKWSTPKSDRFDFAAKDGEDLYIQSAKTRPGVDCGSDYEFLTAKFRLK